MKFSNGGFSPEEQEFWNKMKDISLSFDEQSIYDYWIIFIYFYLGIIRKDKCIISHIQFIIKTKINFNDGFKEITIPIDELKLTNLSHCKQLSYKILHYVYNDGDEILEDCFKKIFNNLTNLFEPDIELNFPIRRGNISCSICGLPSNGFPLFKIDDDQYLCPNCFYSI